MVNFKLNDRELCVKPGTTILEAAEQANIIIPHLCYLKEINEIGACRMCMVEVEGVERLVPACNTYVEEGMVVRTNTPRVRQARRTNLLLLLSQHNSNCTVCVRNGYCELQKMAHNQNIHLQPYAVSHEKSKIDLNVPIIREASKCIKCMRCVQVCDKIQDMHIWDVNGTGTRIKIDATYNLPLNKTDCTYCGQCVTHCPTGALTTRDDTYRVLKALANPEITTVVQVAPAVRVAWAEVFGAVNRNKQVPVGRMVARLKRIGFDYVFDTNFAADLTIMEEGSEFLDRFTHHGRNRWPMFTSCCPGWVRFLKTQFPAYTENLSTAKSPQQMFGAVAKSYFAEKMGLDPKQIFVVSIMPCSAKKAESELPTMKNEYGDPDVDVVLTTREMIRLFRIDSLTPAEMEEEAEFDSPMGSGTGAAAIFGVTGGVMEAALRSAYYMVTGKNPNPDAFAEIRSGQPWREATFNIPGAGDVRVAVVSGLANTRKLMEAVDNGKVNYDFVEVMACPGGCAGGGGQPIHEGIEMAEARGKQLWKLDARADLRFSHENQDVQLLYREYLRRPLGEKSHHLLHTDHNGWQVEKE